MPSFMKPKHTLRDAISFFSDVSNIRVPAFTVIQKLEGHKPHHQIIGTAVALVAMAEACDLNPHDILNQATNCMEHAEGDFTSHVQAIRDYARNELNNI